MFHPQKYSNNDIKFINNSIRESGSFKDNAILKEILKNELESLSLKDIYKEVELHNYPINNYKKLTKEALITEIIIWNADNDIPVEAEELEAVLNNDVDFLNEDV